MFIFKKEPLGEGWFAVLDDQKWFLFFHRSGRRIIDYKSCCEKVFESLWYRWCGLMDRIGKYSVSKFSKARQDITIVTTAHDDREARELLRLLGVPFASK